MKKELKRLVGLLIVFTMVFSSISTLTVFGSNRPIGINVNGKTLYLDQPPVMENGRTLVPLRAIFEELGAQVDWNSNTQTIIGTKDNTTIKLVVGSKNATVNGKPVQLDVPAKVINGRTLVPTRFVAESLGAVVEWDAVNRVVRVTTPDNNEAIIEEYISTFLVTMDLLMEYLEEYYYILMMAPYLDEATIQWEFTKISRSIDFLEYNFNTMDHVKGFEKSQHHMKRSLYHINLVAADNVELIAAIIKGDMRTTDRLQVRIENNFDLFIIEVEKAIDYFFMEFDNYLGY